MKPKIQIRLLRRQLRSALHVLWGRTWPRVRLAQQSQQPNNAWWSCSDSLRSWTVGTRRGLGTLRMSVPLGFWVTAALFVNRRSRLFHIRSCSKHVVRCLSFLQKANLSKKVLDVCPDSRSKLKCLSLLYICIWSYHISAFTSCLNLRLFGPLTASPATTCTVLSFTSWASRYTGLLMT